MGLLSKKSQFFSRGAEAALRTLNVEGAYVCPICERGFKEHALGSGELTFEHVPPRAMGGRAIALTCRNCNNSAGYLLDSEIKKQQEQHRFRNLIMHSKGDYTGRGRLTVDADDLNVQVARDDSTVVLRIMGKANDPAAIERAARYLDGLTKVGDSSGVEFRITSSIKYHKRYSQIGYLRAAYLIAFATFGYRYSFSEALAPVRDQIRNPRQQELDNWMLYLDPKPSIPENAFVKAEEPPCLMVKFGNTGVFLPLAGAATSLYKDLAEARNKCKRLSLSAKAIEWPTALRMDWDFWEGTNDRLHT